MITGRQNEQKCWVTSQNILNNAELQKWYHYDELHAFDIKTNKNVALGRKPFKKRKTTKVIKIQWLASIWRQNEQKCWVTSQNNQNNAKLRKWSNYNELHQTIKATQNSKLDQITMNLHRFDVQTIKNVELRCKPFKTAKVQKWSKYNDLHRFDVKNIKTMLNY